LTLPTAQIAFTDTPGLHRPKTELGRRMNAIALDSVRSHDVVLFVIDIGQKLSGQRFKPDMDSVHPDDRGLLKALPPETPCVLMLNKVDLVRDQGRLRPLLSAFQDAFPFRAIIPTSAARTDGIDRVLDTLVSLLPQAAPKFDSDTLTDKPATFFARETVREQIMHLTHREVPHAVAVTVDRFEDREKLSVIQATIHVEKAGQRAILVGKKGEQIKEIGTRARLQLEELLGRQVHLELFVRVTERWKDVPRQLQELGYEYAHGKQLTNLLPERATTVPRKAKPKERTTKQAGKRAFRGMGKKATGARRSGTTESASKPASGTKPQRTTQTSAAKPQRPAKRDHSAKPRAAKSAARRSPQKSRP